MREKRPDLDKATGLTGIESDALHVYHNGKSAVIIKDDGNGWLLKFYREIITCNQEFKVDTHA